MQYSNKRKFKKKKAREKKARSKVLRNRAKSRYEKRLEKEVEKIKWDNRERIVPLRNDRDKSKETEQDSEDTSEES